MNLIIAGILIVVLLHAAWTDVACRLIPNEHCVAIGSVGAIDRMLNGPTHLAESFAVATVVFLALLLLYARRILGGGDLKLIVAVALCLSLTGLIRFFVATALAGGMLALVHLVLRRMLHMSPAVDKSFKSSKIICRVLTIERWRICHRAPLPYGVAIAGGGIYTILLNIGV